MLPEHLCRQRIDTRPPVGVHPGVGVRLFLRGEIGGESGIQEYWVAASAIELPDGPDRTSVVDGR